MDSLAAINFHYCTLSDEQRKQQQAEEEFNIVLTAV